MPMSRTEVAAAKEDGHTLLVAGAIILCLGLVLCCLTVTYLSGGAAAQPTRFVGQGLIVCALGGAVCAKGVTLYWKALLRLGYENDSI